MRTDIEKAAYGWVVSSPERSGEFMQFLLKKMKPAGTPKKRVMSPATREKLRIAAVKRWEAAKARPGLRKVGTEGNSSNGLRRGHGNSK